MSEYSDGRPGCEGDELTLDSEAAELDLDALRAAVRTALTSETADYLRTITGLDDINEDALFQFWFETLPKTIWLRLSGHKEGSIFHSHAWGQGSVATEREGGRRFPVNRLSVSVEFDSPGGQVRDAKSHGHIAALNFDAEYVGSLPTTPNFKAKYKAQAQHHLYNRGRPWSVRFDLGG